MISFRTLHSPLTLDDDSENNFRRRKFSFSNFPFYSHSPVCWLYSRPWIMIYLIVCHQCGLSAESVVLPLSSVCAFISYCLPFECSFYNLIKIRIHFHLHRILPNDDIIRSPWLECKIEIWVVEILNKGKQSENSLNSREWFEVSYWHERKVMRSTMIQPSDDCDNIPEKTENFHNDFLLFTEHEHTTMTSNDERKPIEWFITVSWDIFPCRLRSFLPTSSIVLLCELWVPQLSSVKFDFSQLLICQFDLSSSQCAFIWCETNGRRRRRRGASRIELSRLLKASLNE